MAAPLLVTMKIARDSANSPHVEAVRRALTTLGASSATLEVVDKRVARPRVGYYFRSDCDAALKIARAVAPILGDVDLLSIALGARIPSPGSIEILFQ